MQLTRDEAILLTCEHIGGADPIDTKRLKADPNIPTTTFLCGHMVDRMIIDAVDALDYWVTTVWKTHDSWKRGHVATQYHVQWPDSVEETKTAALSPGLPPRSMYLAIAVWWWNALKSLGVEWFDAGYHSRAARHLLKSGVLKEMVRRKLANPAIYAHPKVDGPKLVWVITDPIAQTTLGRGHHELTAWEATARSCGVKPPVDKSRPWRAPIEIDVPPPVNATQ